LQIKKCKLNPRAQKEKNMGKISQVEQGGGRKLEKVASHHVCLYDLLKLQHTQLHTAILSRDELAQQNSAIKSQV